MTYTEALKSGEWLAFREKFIEFRRQQDGEVLCDDCGEDTLAGMLHVHHRFYRKYSMPWEYEFDDLRLVCRDCHDLIHSTERTAVNFIRTLPPHVCNEFADFVDELNSLQKPNLVKVALARAKNFAREL